MLFYPVTRDDIRVPALDLAESDRDYTVRVDVPGISKDQIKVNIDGRHVSLEAEANASNDKTEGDRVVYRERRASRFARRFSLPHEVDQAASSAKLDNGVLTLTLAKRNGGARQLQIG